MDTSSSHPTSLQPRYSALARRPETSSEDHGLVEEPLADSGGRSGLSRPSLSFDQLPPEQDLPYRASVGVCAVQLIGLPIRISKRLPIAMAASTRAEFGWDFIGRVLRWEGARGGRRESRDGTH